ncbi:LAS seventeen-binding protein 3 [Nakaseomyces bracarensis]|uniref:LAS seventeen-binding protein 3 n=1 Tax=Nakaseomyces bracarensis TaxID=273131 RepID=A0ABR4NP08_9SACH
MGINNPIPRSLNSETKKAAKILANFVKPNQVFGADQVIPPHVLKNAKGLAVITVLKAGFLFSGRAGSGVIVARQRDGTWSAPSAIAMAGAGAGGLVGVELTDFVFILNTQEAVRSFSEFGTITLGGNISVSAGPLGRNAEAAASASAGGVSAVFAYSKSKGLFAGVSLEGSVILERREANRKFYGNNCTTKMILSGRIRPPPSVDPLFRVLESRAFNYKTRDDDYDYDSEYDDDYYDDIPSSFGSTRDDSSSRFGRSGSMRRGRRDDDDYSRHGRGGGGGGRRGGYRDDDYDDFEDDFDDPSGAKDYYASHRRGGATTGGRNRSSRYDDDRDRDYGRDHSSRRSYENGRDVDDLSNRFSKSRISSSGATNGGSYSRPAADPPRSTSSGIPKAVALYSFAGEEAGDLPFRKGDVITIIKKSDSQNDWWTGKVNGREGIFPANYVELV